MSIAFLFMMGQALTAVPALPPGTIVDLSADDLLSVYLKAVVLDGKLVFRRPEDAGPNLQFRPGIEVQIFIWPASGSGPGQGPISLRGRVSADGSDIFVDGLDGQSGSVSFRAWLAITAGITLVLPEQ
jgi:hypothetical protein